MFKASVALAELAQLFDVHPNQLTEWNRKLSEQGADSQALRRSRRLI